MQKSEVIKKHKIKPEESEFYHVLFTKIVKDGLRTKDVYNIVLYSRREFPAFKHHIDQWGLGSTGMNEYEIIHDPNKKVDSEIDDIKAYLVENGIDFDSRLGLAKLQKLYNENKLKTD